MESRLCPRNHIREILAATGSVLCGPCIQQLEHNLRTLPVLHQELLHDMASTPRRTNPTKVSGSRSRDHLNMSVFDTRHDILTILESWSGFVVEKLGTITPTRSVLHLTCFLMDNSKWLTAQPSAADFADDIESLHVESLRAANPEPGDHNALTMKCVVDDCLGTIDTSTQSIDDSSKSSLRCSSGHSWKIGEWLILRHLSIDSERTNREQATTPQARSN
jgi:hypothetical protein